MDTVTNEQFYASVTDGRLHNDLLQIARVLARRRLANRAGLVALQAVIMAEAARRGIR